MMNDKTSRRRRCGLPRQAAILAAAAGIALLTAACSGSSSAGGSGGSSTPGGSGGSSPAGSPARQKQLTWSQCMRSHGVDVPTSVPSPAPSSTANKAVKVGGPVVNPNSPQYKAALQACKSLQPGESRLGG